MDARRSVNETFGERVRPNPVPLMPPAPWCTICRDTLPTNQLVPLPCGSKYCKDCLVDLFAYATESFVLFPPKCCNVVLHAHDYLSILPEDTVRKYIRLAKVHGERNRTSCATEKCHGVSIDPISIHNDWALCEQCLQLTCVRCQQSEMAHQPHVTNTNLNTHTTGDTTIENTTPIASSPTNPPTPSIPVQSTSAPTRICPPKLIDHELEALAKEKEWRRCPACEALIERIDGCSEMMCICGEPFCYDCGRTRRLYSDGEEVCECVD